MLLLLLVAGCGAEQFGTVPQSEKSQPDGIQTFEQLSCSSYTLIKPKVDILYVVDNSTSTFYLQDDIKNALKSTVDSISKDFDYRVIGTNLLPTSGDANPNDDYQILTNSQDSLSATATSRKIISSSEFNFFATTSNGAEQGLQRIYDFINVNKADGLFRNGSYVLVVLISNGRDTDVETDAGFGNGETTVNTSIYNSRKSNLLALKTSLASEQLRLFSVTARTSCKSGWLSSLNSYVQMSTDLYASNASATDQGSAQWPDSYDLCVDGLSSSVFTAVNNSIKQVVVPHVYKYWPITFAENNETVSLADVQVFKVTGNAAPVEVLSNSGANWDYYANPGFASNVPLNTRELPTSGEPVYGKHFVEFKDGNKITYPDCVLVKSISRTEYFGYVVLPKEPKVETVVIRINGQPISQSATDGWSYVGNKLNQNIKMAYPNPGDESPEVLKSGFMIQLNGSNNYYKSGDSVEVYYLPAGI